MQHYVLNKVKKPGLREDAPQQKLSLFHNAPGTIGGFVSHGCIRMYNADIMDLYSRVGVGTRVVVTR